MDGKLSELINSSAYQQHRAKFILELRGVLEQFSKQRLEHANDIEIFKRLTNFLDSNKDADAIHIISNVTTFAKGAYREVQVKDGVFSTKTEHHPTPFSQSLTTVLQKYDHESFLMKLEKDHAALLMYAKSNDNLNELQRLKEEVTKLQGKLEKWKLAKTALAEVESNKGTILRLKEQVEVLEGERDELRGQLTSKDKSLRSLEEEVRELDQQHIDAQNKVSLIQERLANAKKEEEELTDKLNELTQKQTALLIKQARLEAEAETLKALNSNLTEEKKEKMAKYEATIKSLQATIDQQNQLIFQNQQFVANELHQTLRDVQDSLNQSRIERDLNKSNAATTAPRQQAASVASQREKMHSDNAAVDPKREAFISNQFKYITSKDKEYLTPQRINALRQVVFYIHRKDATAEERAFGIKCIKILADKQQAKLLSTNACIAEMKLETPKTEKTVLLLKQLDAMKADDGGQKQLDPTNLVKLNHALHLLFTASGYDIRELTEYYPAQIVAGKGENAKAEPLASVTANTK